jgi:hypothetical protein
VKYWRKDCNFSRKIIDFDSIMFKINGSRIDPQCIIFGWYEYGKDYTIKASMALQECLAII